MLVIVSVEWATYLASLFQSVLKHLDMTNSPIQQALSYLIPYTWEIPWGRENVFNEFVYYVFITQSLVVHLLSNNIFLLWGDIFSLIKLVISSIIGDIFSFIFCFCLPTFSSKEQSLLTFPIWYLTQSFVCLILAQVFCSDYSKTS